MRALKAHGPGDVGSVEWSHRYYYDYASEALAGKVPYRDFAFEYPVLSYPLFLVPRLLVSDFESYRFAFDGRDVPLRCRGDRPDRPPWR